MLATLAWDLPRISFGQGRTWFRGYIPTNGAGTAGTRSESRSWPIRSAPDWERRISEWHEDVSEVLGSAPHRAGVTINESYFLVDGLTVTDFGTWVA